MSGSLDSVNWKIEQAKRHMTNLKEKIQEFNSTHPYQIATKRDSENRLIYYVGEIKNPPPEIGLIVGDVLHSLRSALDHLAYQLVIANEQTPSKHIYFPIADSIQKYNVSAPAKVSGMSSQAIAMIDSIKPYKEGNSILWAIHHLDIVDKHRVLITVDALFGSVDVGNDMQRRMQELVGNQFKVPTIPLFLKPADNLCPLTIGTELFIDAPGAEVDPTRQFSFEITLYEPSILESEPIIPMLNNFIGEVESVVNKLKSFL